MRRRASSVVTDSSAPDAPGHNASSAQSEAHHLAESGGKSPSTRLRRSVPRWSSVWILAFLIIEVITFAILLPSGTFLTTFNLTTILGDSAVVLLLATAATIVIITGGIDLSIGSLLTLAAVVAAKTMASLAADGASTVVAIGVGAAAGVGVATVWGVVNGIVITRLAVPPFIATLGSLGAALGVARLLSGGGTSTGGAPPPQLQDDFGQADVVGLPLPFLVAAILMILFGLLLVKTRLGEHLYIIGSNEEAAHRGGIHVNRRLIVVYGSAGLLAGAAGVVDLARFDVASTATGHVTELIAAIAAVVIGGASLFGGRGSMVGTAIGVYIPVILANGLLIGGIERFWQDVILGAMLVTAVAFDQWRRRQETKSAVAVTS